MSFYGLFSFLTMAKVFQLFLLNLDNLIYLWDTTFLVICKVFTLLFPLLLGYLRLYLLF